MRSEARRALFLPNKKMKNETATSEKCVADTTGISLRRVQLYLSA